MPRLKVGLILDCASAREWETWLAANHHSVAEAWLRLAKKGSTAVSVTRAEALEVALTYGWIDGQSATQDATFWLQRFTPRTKRSKWSQINCQAVEKLIGEGRMKPAGMAAVEAAKADGRWDAAYAPPSKAEVHPDLRAALQRNRAAQASFEQLSAQSRYSILYRIADARKPETRLRRIEKYVGMLERGETIR